MSLPSAFTSVLGKHTPLNPAKPDDWTHVTGLYFTTPAGLTVVPALCHEDSKKFECKLLPELTCEEGSKCVAVQLEGATRTTDGFELDTIQSLRAINDMITKATREYESLQKQHFQSRLHTEVQDKPKSSEDEGFGSRIRTYEQLLSKLNYGSFWDWDYRAEISGETDGPDGREQATCLEEITKSIATWYGRMAAFNTLRHVFNDVSSATETAEWNTKFLGLYRSDVARYEAKCAGDPAKIAKAKSDALAERAARYEAKCAGDPAKIAKAKSDALKTFNSCFNASETLQSDAPEAVDRQVWTHC